MRILNSARRRIAAYLRASPILYDLARQTRLRVMGASSLIGVQLDRYSKTRPKDFTFLQIGANDGLRNDPVRDFVVRDCWKGVFVEPLPDVFPLLEQNYRCYRKRGSLQFLNAAVSSRSGALPFYTFAETFLAGKSLEQRLHYLRKASFSREQVAPFAEHEDNIRVVDVPCISIGELLSRYFPAGHLDLLALDVEGYEPEILREIHFDAFSIGAVLFETWNLGPNKEEVFRLLRASGYDIAEAEGDALAISTRR